MLWQTTFSDSKHNHSLLKKVVGGNVIFWNFAAQWKEIKGIQLKVSPARCNPSCAIAYIKAFTICTLTQNMGRVSNAKQQNGRIC